MKIVLIFLALTLLLFMGWFVNGPTSTTLHGVDTVIENKG